jgi:hypothetical protein
MTWRGLGLSVWAAVVASGGGAADGRFLQSQPCRARPLNPLPCRSLARRGAPAGCPKCQPLLEGTEVTPQRRASMAAAKVAKVRPRGPVGRPWGAVTQRAARRARLGGRS